MLKKTLCLWLGVTLFSFNLSAQSTADYIEKYSSYAQSMMQEHKIPASIILAVAIHESASGTSKIARFLNNHFGIKGSNSNTEIQSSYKDYSTVKESYDHFLDFLKSRGSFSPLFEKYDQYDYRNWAKGIQRGGYARSRIWASQIIEIIKRNELFQYDNRPEDYAEPVIPEPKPSYRNSSEGTKKYIVKRGDNLSTIARDQGTTIKTLVKKNGLRSSALKPGQKLKI